MGYPVNVQEWRLVWVGLGWWIYHFLTDIVCELSATVSTASVYAGLTFWRGSVLEPAARSANLDQSQAHLSASRPMGGSQVSVRLYSASVRPVLSKLNSGTALVRWLAAQWRGLTGGDAGTEVIKGFNHALLWLIGLVGIDSWLDLRSISFEFQSDVDFNRMASDKSGFPGQCGSLFCHCRCSCRRMLFW